MFGIAMQLLTAVTLAVAILLNSTGNHSLENYVLFLSALFLLASVAASLIPGESSPNSKAPPAEVATPPPPPNRRKGFVPANEPSAQQPAQNAGEIRGFTF
jgi:hypothetical protein